MSIRLPKIFLDSGNPEDTKRAKGLIGFLDGQTTNPSLITKHPEVAKLLEKGMKLTEKELLDFYRQIVREIEKEVAGPISVEVYADWETKASVMLKQAHEMFTWGKNVYIKFPTIPEGVKAAHEFVKNKGRVNMTLVFNQNQAAAVYSSTLPDLTDSTDSNRFNHFVSPFIGRWDDRGINGLDLVKNILKMYKKFDHLQKRKKHVLVLAASIRHLSHFYASIFLGADIITIPLKVIQAWVEEEQWIPGTNYRIETSGLKSLIYQDLPLRKNYSEYKIESTSGSLLDEGLKKFVADWKSILG